MLILEPSAAAVREVVGARRHWRRAAHQGPGTDNRGARMIPVTQFRLSTTRHARRGLSVATIVTAGTLAAGALGAAPAGATTHFSTYRQINLVSDQAGKAQLTDPDLVNAWGLAASPGTNAAPGSPLWVADNGSDKATLYAGASATSVSKVPLVVDVTGAAPTGQVFNSDSVRVRGQRQPWELGLVAVPLRHRERHDRRLEPGGQPRRHQPVHGDRGGQEQRRQRGVQGPGDRQVVGRHDAVRHQLPVRPGRGLRRHVHPGRTARRAVRGPEAARPVTGRSASP